MVWRPVLFNFFLLNFNWIEVNDIWRKKSIFWRQFHTYLNIPKIYRENYNKNIIYNQHFNCFHFSCILLWYFIYLCFVLFCFVSLYFIGNILKEYKLELHRDLIWDNVKVVVQSIRSTLNRFGYVSYIIISI